MKRLLRSRFLVFALLLAVGMGSVVSVVQAGQMRVDMALAAAAQDADANTCSACGVPADEANVPMDCAAACHLTAVGLADAAPARHPADIQVFGMVRERSAHASILLIDPSPPKPVLG